MRRTFALLLAAVMAAGTLTGPAMAAESQKEGTADSASQEVQEETKLPPDPEGTVTWANLDSRIRSGSLSARVLSENISGIEGIDYDLMYEDLRRQLNDIANAQWYITMMGGDDSSLANAYDSLRDTFDDLKDGEVQADNADAAQRISGGDCVPHRDHDLLHIAGDQGDHAGGALRGNGPDIGALGAQLAGLGGGGLHRHRLVQHGLLLLRAAGQRQGQGRAEHSGNGTFHGTIFHPFSHIRPCSTAQR